MGAIPRLEVENSQNNFATLIAKLSPWQTKVNPRFHQTGLKEFDDGTREIVPTYRRASNFQVIKATFPQ